MPLETATTISGLDINNPFDDATDEAKKGYQHIQLLKDVLKKQFPGVGGVGFARAILAVEAEINKLVGAVSPIQAQIDALQGSVMQVGDILMYHGLLADLPANFKLCNGSNGTPDLTNRFVMGSASDADIGTSGGNNDSAVISHNHSTGHSHTYTTSTDGAHTHIFSNGGSGSGGTNVLYGENNNAGTTEISAYTEYDIQHDHPVTMTTNTATIDTVGGTTTDKNMPPFYTLAYIQRVS